MPARARTQDLYRACSLTAYQRPVVTEDQRADWHGHEINVESPISLAIPDQLEPDVSANQPGLGDWQKRTRPDAKYSAVRLPALTERHRRESWSALALPKFQRAAPATRAALKAPANLALI